MTDDHKRQRLEWMPGQDRARWAQERIAELEHEVAQLREQLAAEKQATADATALMTMWQERAGRAQVETCDVAGPHDHRYCAAKSPATEQVARCVGCKARWRYHGDGAWSLLPGWQSGPCCRPGPLALEPI